MYHRYYPCKLCLEPGEKEDELQFHNTNYNKIQSNVNYLQNQNCLTFMSFHQTICSIEYYKNPITPSVISINYKLYK